MDIGLLFAGKVYHQPLDLLNTKKQELRNNAIFSTFGSGADHGRDAGF